MSLPFMHRSAAILLLLALAGPLHGDPRPWRNADGSRSVRGEFMKRDDRSVSIVRTDRKEIVIPLDQLHPDDRRWLDAEHPVTPVDTPEVEPTRGVFGILEFGDTREETLRKLRESEIVELNIPEAMLARVGTNGAFRTKAKVGGKNALLFFDWTEDGKLRDIQLRSDPVPAAGYQDSLANCWKELAELLTVLHGKPVVSADKLPSEAPAEGEIKPTHAWKLEEGGTAQLGPAKEDGEVRMVVHFTSETLIRETRKSTAGNR
ncbi:MAG: hypothetical protein H7A49_13590 [Akkermansiaceae bacterium]|nr:hypothetical protein [Akkermansiaceae bacterium]MCP5544925.1 hypothetical protein [Akkermansiaceae bacterium]